MQEIGKIFITAGIVIALFGLVIKLQIFGLGRLPGDIYIKNGNFTFYAPIATGIIISLIIAYLFLLMKK